MKEYYIGLDIGGTKCGVVLGKVDHGIQIVDKVRFETSQSVGFEAEYHRLLDGVRTLLSKNQLSLAQIEAIGVSCGGPLDSKKGIILSPPNLPGWDNVPLTQRLEQDLHIPAYLQNDANACALVEWKLGAGRGCENMIFLTMGTGMGAGVIAEGRLLHGASDLCGEIGHIRLTENGPVGFGKEGSVEGYTSGGGIQRQAQELTRRLIENNDPPQWANVPNDELDTKLLAEYARRGDPLAKQFF